MRISKVILSILVILCSSCKKVNKSKSNPETTAENKRPNIVIFYVDDLGYGDIGAYGAERVKTPNVDRLASQGIKFVDAHSSAATCTPSRYALLTGQYAFRNNTSILPGDAPLIIDENDATVPKMLKSAGYRTGVVGKWHLGLGRGNLDWNGSIEPGPLEIGFDYSFLIPATGDRVPAVYVENHKVVNLEAKDDPLVVDYNKKVGNMPDGLNNKDLLRQEADVQHSNTIINGVSRIGYMDGGESAIWVDEEFPDILTDKAIDFIETSSKDPFFLFFSFHDIHVPRIPNERFIGKSSMGPRGDAIVQMDWTTGRIMEVLKENGLLENTLVIFTSDNGPVLNDGYEDRATELLGHHKPSGPFRGGKYSAFEGGTRVPTITYWKNHIVPGESKALLSQVDLYASLAAIAGLERRADEAIDSQDVSLALLNASEKARDIMVEESFTLSLRMNNWKYIQPVPYGQKMPDFIERKGIEGGHSRDPQLYNLEADSAETDNLAQKHPQILFRMKNQLDSIKNVTLHKTQKTAP